MTPAFEFRDVTKTYRLGLWGRRRNLAVIGVSLAVEPGEVFGLPGADPAGQTAPHKPPPTASKPEIGEVFRLGAPWSDRSTLGRVGYVHENQAFPKYLTAASLLDYYGALTLVPPDAVRKR